MYGVEEHITPIDISVQKIIFNSTCSYAKAQCNDCMDVECPEHPAMSFEHVMDNFFTLISVKSQQKTHECSFFSTIQNSSQFKSHAAALPLLLVFMRLDCSRFVSVGRSAENISVLFHDIHC